MTHAFASPFAILNVTCHVVLHCSSFFESSYRVAPERNTAQRCKVVECCAVCCYCQSASLSMCGVVVFTRYPQVCQRHMGLLQEVKVKLLSELPWTQGGGRCLGQTAAPGKGGAPWIWLCVRAIAIHVSQGSRGPSH